jgi:hypothetical protein
MKTSIPRLRAARFKDGREIRVIRNEPARECLRSFDSCVTHLRKAREADMVGFALVAWSLDGIVSRSLCITGGPIGAGMAPDFVRSTLIDHLAKD